MARLSRAVARARARGGKGQAQRNRARHKVITMPVGGLNLRDPVDAMEDRFALELLNILPDETTLRTRPGYAPAPFARATATYDSNTRTAVSTARVSADDAIAMPPIEDTGNIVSEPSFFTATVLLNALSDRIAEGHTLGIAASLSQRPLSNVTVTTASSDTSAVTVTPETLTFTPDDWHTPQRITLLAVEDADRIGETVTISFEASGGGYESSIASAMQVTVIDTASVIADASTLAVVEGETGDIDVRLNQQPTADVTVTVASADGSRLTVVPETLTFTADDWDQPQTVTVTAESDADAMNNTVLVTLTPSSGGYDDAGAASVSVVITDDDADIIVTPGIVEVVEGGDAAVLVRLGGAAPTADVTVNAASSDPAVAAVSPESLTFTPDDWDTAQPVTISTVYDTDADNETASITFDAAGRSAASVGVTVIDDEAQPSVRRWREPGTYMWTVPRYVSRIMIEAVGGGGLGGDGGAGVRIGTSSPHPRLPGYPGVKGGASSVAVGGVIHQAEGGAGGGGGGGGTDRHQTSAGGGGSASGPAGGGGGGGQGHWRRQERPGGGGDGDAGGASGEPGASPPDDHGGRGGNGPTGGLGGSGGNGTDAPVEGTTSAHVMIGGGGGGGASGGRASLTADVRIDGGAADGGDGGGSNPDTLVFEGAGDGRSGAAGSASVPGMEDRGGGLGGEAGDDYTFDGNRGGGGGGGGSGGAYARWNSVAVMPGQLVTISVGAGGSAGSGDDTRTAQGGMVRLTVVAETPVLPTMAEPSDTAPGTLYETEKTFAKLRIGATFDAQGATAVKALYSDTRPENPDDGIVFAESDGGTSWALDAIHDDVPFGRYYWFKAQTAREFLTRTIRLREWPPASLTAGTAAWAGNWRSGAIDALLYLHSDWTALAYVADEAATPVALTVTGLAPADATRWARATNFRGRMIIAGLEWPVLVNPPAAAGDDPTVEYGQSVWRDKSGSSARDFANFFTRDVVAFNERLMFLERESAVLWYGGIDEIKGDLEDFDLADVYPEGGNAEAIGAISLDTGSGIDTILVICMESGAAVCYAGTDISDAGAWALRGIYQIGRTFGHRPMVNYGGDLLVLTDEGVLSMRAILSNRTPQEASLSRNVQPGIAQRRAEYADRDDEWGLLVDRSARDNRQYLIVNGPDAEQSGGQVQFALNLRTQAWGMWAIPAGFWTRWRNETHCLIAGTVFIYGRDRDDNGAPIAFTVATPYSYLGVTTTKKFARVRPAIKSYLGQAAPRPEMFMSEDPDKPYVCLGAVSDDDRVWLAAPLTGARVSFRVEGQAGLRATNWSFLHAIFTAAAER